ncbi:MAG: PD-(D/E)XK nuclease family protein, partial [Streptococcus dysgalactiae]|nr:PD-(D/E)XK nuclease family protein [Streptococcus dysgalactiae]
DPLSQEDYVIRGIIDAFLLFEDHIELIDYKTDRYRHPSDLKTRYQQQLELYAEALSQTYGLPVTKKYLVLMGGPELAIVTL